MTIHQMVSGNPQLLEPFSGLGEGLNMTGIVKSVALAVGALTALGLASPAAAQFSGGTCAPEALQAVTDKFLEAQRTGDTTLLPLGEWLDYNENNRPASMLSGILRKPQTIDWYRVHYDTTACRSFIEMIVTNPDHPYVLATQLDVRGTSVGRINTIITDKGDWLFDAAKTLEYTKAENWEPIPEAQRNTRKELIAAADAYLDLFSDKTVQVPWGTPCARLEGSAYTAKGTAQDSCNVGVPENVEMADRSYVVDPELGSVGVFLKMGENARPDSHLFRIENGKIRYIHTVTNCGDQDNCGFSPFAEMLQRNPDIHPRVGG
ncbi:hypothetical protein [Altericroceibacterium xinjiangense]|uniref:hypothetical protein n=1 Tax=Altericroceibacterium xinjiangense TaxID=762261 RepID=UPI000F7EA242|nr:hypothetical protein [Altericroceibacterium xinjiangense]